VKKIKTNTYFLHKKVENIFKIISREIILIKKAVKIIKFVNNLYVSRGTCGKTIFYININSKLFPGK
jgi:hypothetical protein